MAEPIRWQDLWWHQQPDGSWLLFNEETQSWESYATPPGVPLYAPSPGMSTGTKWVIGVAIALVILFIVAILAAIAIPVFLRQREKAWISQVEVALREVAIAEQSHCAVVDSEQCYTTSIEELHGGRLRVPPEVDIDIVRADRRGFCIEGRHEMLPNDVWSIDSKSRLIDEASCN